MTNHKFTFEYTDDQLKIHHNEAPRFTADLQPEHELSILQNIEWKDKPAPDPLQLAALMQKAAAAYIDHERNVQSDLKQAFDNLNTDDTAGL